MPGPANFHKFQVLDAIAQTSVNSEIQADRVMIRRSSEIPILRVVFLFEITISLLSYFSVAPTLLSR
jgi:hypothetical protein